MCTQWGSERDCGANPAPTQNTHSDPPPKKKEITDPHTPDFEVLDEAVAGGFYQGLGRVVVDAVAWGQRGDCGWVQWNCGREHNAK